MTRSKPQTRRATKFVPFPFDAPRFGASTALALAVLASSALGGCKSGGNASGSGGSGSGGSHDGSGGSGSGGSGSGGDGSGGAQAASGGSGSGSGGGAATGGSSGTTACKPPTDVNQPIAKLADTGCMSATAPTAFASAIFPYTVNSPLWSDAADKSRGFVLPAGGKIHVKNCADSAENCAGGATDPDDGKWVFPVGTVMVKNFSFDGKTVETRLFVHHDADTWVGYSYAWTEDQAGATIVASAGAEVNFNTGSRTVDWHYPSRDNCMKCHKPTGGDTLGPETDQMNRMAASGGMNQIDQLQQMGAFDKAVPTPYKAALVTPYASQVGMPSSSATAEQKARSYLQANCAFCHRPDDPDYFLTDMRFGVPLGDMGLCGQDPQKSDLGVIGSKRLDPGNPMNSLMWLRMKAPPDGVDKYGRMPPIASYITDDAGAQVISDWISGLSGPCPAPTM
ncbi:MAG TPA: hypothetical protein VGP07_08250 [Polyangia bacterium]|jgi:hypothetical protein